MIARPQHATLLLTLSLITACGVSEPYKPVVETQTNEQGCVRVRSTGPQDPAAIPVPIKQACVGPYLLELPQNYFDNQMGTEFDGSFALALEYPSLEPFLPGERKRYTADLRVRTVMVSFYYIDRIDINQAMLNAYTNTISSPDDPAASLEGRQIGESLYGLTPYYADMNRIRDYLRREGFKDSAAGMQDRWNQDWFLASASNEDLETIVKCTSRNVIGPGAELRQGKMIRGVESPVPECVHTFAIKDHDILVRVTYVRVALPQWRRIEERVRKLILSSVIADMDGAHK